MKSRRIARHLFQGKAGYHARMAVPAALRSIIGKKEFWAAIRANTDAGAVRKLPAIIANMQAQIDAARAEYKAGKIQALPPPRGRLLSPRQLAVAHYDGELVLDDQMRNAGAYVPGHREWSKAGYAAALQRVASGAAEPDECAAVIGWAIDMLIANGHVKVHPGSTEWRALARQQAAIQLEVEKRKDERDRGEGESAPRHPLLAVKPVAVAVKDALFARNIGEDSTKTLSEIVPDFAKERGAGPQVNYEWRTTARMFEEYLGEAKPLYTITRSDVRGFQRALSNSPAHSAKLFPGLTFPEAIKANQARIVPHPLLNSRTINEGYLSRLHSIFNWCVRNDVIPDNPATGIKVDTVKDKGKPPPVGYFTPSDLGRIFSAKLYDTSKTFDELQWAALFALFTGARATEIAQIRLDSIRHERGVLVAAIEEETKNAGSQRLIPIHSVLINLGFERRVEKLRNDGASHLFPEWYHKGIEAKQRAEAGGKVTLNHHFPRFIPRAFNVTILPKVGIHDSRKKFHSFRHTFKTGLARAGVARSMQDDLCGHADNSAGAGYVHGELVEAMKEAIEKLRFDGFVLGTGVAG